LLAAGKPLRPVTVLVECVDQIRQADHSQYRFEFAPIMGLGEVGVGDRIGERAKRQIGTLRQEQSMAVADSDIAATEWPKPGDRAQQRALAEPDGPITRTGAPGCAAKVTFSCRRWPFGRSSASPATSTPAPERSIAIGIVSC